jgi:hypothetical protein
MDFKRLSDRAKVLVDKRGGSEGLKQDAAQLREIAKGPGSIGDKAKAAVSALKEPGTREAGAPAAEAASGTERARAEEKVAGEARGKHKHAAEQPGGNGVQRGGNGADRAGAKGGRAAS